VGECTVLKVMGVENERMCEGEGSVRVRGFEGEGEEGEEGQKG